MDVLLAALALGLGFLLGLAVGAARAFALVRHRRAVAGAAVGLARLLPETLPGRSVTDMINNQIRVRLAGQTFVLPILPRGAALEAASDDTPAVVALLMAHPDKLLAMLRTYDVSGILPDDGWIDDYATDAEILMAAIELWRASNPFPAAVAEMASTSETTGISPEPSSSSPTPTAGVPTTSTAS